MNSVEEASARLSWPVPTSHLNLRPIEARDAVAAHHAARRVLVKLGFRQEGMRKQVWRCHGQWVDAVRFGLLREQREPTR